MACEFKCYLNVKLYPCENDSVIIFIYDIINESPSNYNKTGGTRLTL